jgi:SRSO17 transposase
MTTRKETTTAPRPLEEYIRPFDGLFGKWNQREGFRRCLEGLLLPTERNKTLTGLANTEPVAGAQDRQAQSLQWFLSESNWDERTVQAQRLKRLLEDPLTTPSKHGVLVIDEHGDRKAGDKIAHVGRQYLGNLGKVDNGVVSVTSLWADEGVYYPIDFEPYTPAHHFEQGEDDPAFRTKLRIALELVNRAVQLGLPFEAVVADNFYGEDRTLRKGLRDLHLGYALALKPSHSWWHRIGTPGSLQEVAQEAGWKSAEQPGQWVKVQRSFRDGSRQTWWALEVQAGPYGPEKTERAVVATTDPETLPDKTTWYLVTNLPAPGSVSAEQSPLTEASLAEVIRLYGLRMWIEQSYKQVKHALGWSEYQVRSDQAIRRHWQLVCCAFSFCWYHHSHFPADQAWLPENASCQTLEQSEQAPEGISGVGKKKKRASSRSTPPLLAPSPARGQSLAGTMDHAAALLAGLVYTAPTSSTSAIT